MGGEVAGIASVAGQAPYWTERDGIAALRRSFIGALGDYYAWQNSSPLSNA